MYSVCLRRLRELDVGDDREKLGGIDDVKSFGLYRDDAQEDKNDWEWESKGNCLIHVYLENGCYNSLCVCACVTSAYTHVNGKKQRLTNRRQQKRHMLNPSWFGTLRKQRRLPAVASREWSTLRTRSSNRKHSWVGCSCNVSVSWSPNSTRVHRFTNYLNTFTCKK